MSLRFVRKVSLFPAHLGYARTQADAMGLLPHLHAGKLSHRQVEGLGLARPKARAEDAPITEGLAGRSWAIA
jgi:hypothetical protein